MELSPIKFWRVTESSSKIRLIQVINMYILYVLDKTKILSYD